LSSMMEVTDTQIVHTFLDKLQRGASPLSSVLVEQAEQAIRSTQVPTTRTEAWKYTRVARLTRKEYTQQAAHPATVPQIVPGALRLVFVNGFHVASLSDQSFPEGMTVKSLRDCTPEELAKAGTGVPLENELFNAINTAYAQDGAYVEIAAKANIEPVIELI